MDSTSASTTSSNEEKAKDKREQVTEEDEDTLEEGEICDEPDTEDHLIGLAETSSKSDTIKIAADSTTNIPDSSNSDSLENKMPSELVASEEITTNEELLDEEWPRPDPDQAEKKRALILNLGKEVKSSEQSESVVTASNFSGNLDIDPEELKELIAKKAELEAELEDAKSDAKSDTSDEMYGNILTKDDIQRKRSRHSSSDSNNSSSYNKNKKRLKNLLSSDMEPKKPSDIKKAGGYLGPPIEKNKTDYENVFKKYASPQKTVSKNEQPVKSSKVPFEVSGKKFTCVIKDNDSSNSNSKTSDDKKKERSKSREKSKEKDQRRSKSREKSNDQEIQPGHQIEVIDRITTWGQTQHNQIYYNPDYYPNRPPFPSHRPMMQGYVPQPTWPQNQDYNLGQGYNYNNPYEGYQQQYYCPNGSNTQYPTPYVPPAQQPPLPPNPPPIPPPPPPPENNAHPYNYNQQQHQNVPFQQDPNVYQQYNQHVANNSYPPQGTPPYFNNPIATQDPQPPQVPGDITEPPSLMSIPLIPIVKKPLPSLLDVRTEIPNTIVPPNLFNQSCQEQDNNQNNKKQQESSNLPNINYSFDEFVRQKCLEYILALPATQLRSPRVETPPQAAIPSLELENQKEGQQQNQIKQLQQNQKEQQNPPEQKQNQPKLIQQNQQICKPSQQQQRQPRQRSRQARIESNRRRRLKARLRKQKELAEILRKAIEEKQFKPCLACGYIWKHTRNMFTQTNPLQNKKNKQVSTVNLVQHRNVGIQSGTHEGHTIEMKETPEEKYDSDTYSSNADSRETNMDDDFENNMKEVDAELQFLASNPIVKSNEEGNQDLEEGEILSGEENEGIETPMNTLDNVDLLTNEKDLSSAQTEVNKFQNPEIFKSIKENTPQNKDQSTGMETNNKELDISSKNITAETPQSKNQATKIETNNEKHETSKSETQDVNNESSQIKLLLEECERLRNEVEKLRAEKVQQHSTTKEDKIMPEKESITEILQLDSNTENTMNLVTEPKHDKSEVCKEVISAVPEVVARKEASVIEKKISSVVSNKKITATTIASGKECKTTKLPNTSISKEKKASGIEKNTNKSDTVNKTIISNEKQVVKKKTKSSNPSIQKSSQAAKCTQKKSTDSIKKKISSGGKSVKESEAEIQKKSTESLAKQIQTESEKRIAETKLELLLKIMKPCVVVLDKRAVSRYLEAAIQAMESRSQKEADEKQERRVTRQNIQAMREEDRNAVAAIVEPEIPEIKLESPVFENLENLIPADKIKSEPLEEPACEIKCEDTVLQEADEICPIKEEPMDVDEPKTSTTPVSIEDTSSESILRDKLSEKQTPSTSRPPVQVIPNFSIPIIKIEPQVFSVELEPAVTIPMTDLQTDEPQQMTSTDNVETRKPTQKKKSQPQWVLPNADKASSSSTSSSKSSSSRVAKKSTTKTQPPPSNKPSTSQSKTTKSNDLKRNVYNLCKKQYGASLQLSQHLQTHVTTSPNTCAVCKRSFDTPYVLKCHMALTHSTKEKKHLCEICGKRFSELSQLQYHKNLIHNNKKARIPMIKCVQCTEKFISRESLDLHMKIDHPTEFVKCKICYKQFSCNMYLNMHMKKIHPNNTIKCQLCNHETDSFESLQKHVDGVH